MFIKGVGAGGNGGGEGNKRVGGVVGKSLGDVIEGTIW